MAFKSCFLELKDLDRKQGIVQGYFASFGNIDADGDVFVKGAFAKSINENGPKGRRRIKYLKQHDVNLPLGVITDLVEDEKGLLFTAKMADTSLGRDMLVLYEEGVYNEHSVGFSYIPDKISQERGATYLREVKLFEGSAVLWGANDETPLVDLKSEFELTNLLQKMEDALKIGRLSDNTLKHFSNIYSLLREKFEKPQPALNEIEQASILLSLSNLKSLIK